MSRINENRDKSSKYKRAKVNMLCEDIEGRITKFVNSYEGDTFTKKTFKGGSSKFYCIKLRILHPSGHK